jgi:hypothetical protein
LRIAVTHNDIDLLPDKLGSDLHSAVDASVSEASFDCDGTALD